MKSELIKSYDRYNNWSHFCFVLISSLVLTTTNTTNNKRKKLKFPTKFPKLHLWVTHTLIHTHTHPFNSHMYYNRAWYLYLIPIIGINILSSHSLATFQYVYVYVCEWWFVLKMCVISVFFSLFFSIWLNWVV